MGVKQKLIRDKIPKIAAENGDKLLTRILSDDEYRIKVKETG